MERVHQENLIKERKKNNDNYLKNREYYTEKHDCDCGGKYTTKRKAVHFKTQKHQEYIKKT